VALIRHEYSILVLPVPCILKNVSLQRKIFTFAEATLPKLGYKKRAHLMNAMVPGLAGSKMSSSDPNSKIDFLDAPNVVKKKIKNAFCEEGNVTENGVLAFVKVLISISRLRMENITAGDTSGKQPFVAEVAPPNTVFSIARPDKYGGPLHYSSFEEMETDFAAKKLHPGDLKLGVTNAINALLEPVQKAFENSPEFGQAALNAYPPDVTPPKETKKKVCASPSYSASLQTNANGKHASCTRIREESYQQQ
jgi:tyrosyl-tRNA synthetase